jgi:hypothetical protein
MPSRYATALVLALAVMTGEQALAHGEARARHGGTAVMASDLGFELVGIPGGVALYIEDHGKPLAPTGFRGKIALLSGTEKAEAELVPTADRLEARGLRLGPGVKAVATLTTAERKVITVRFSVR